MTVPGRGRLGVGDYLGPGIGFDVVLVEVVPPVDAVIAPEYENRVVEGHAGVERPLPK